MKNRLLFAALVILFFPSSNFGQAPALGTAANFVLFTTVGAVTNTGISQITGNIGTNSGSSTGFGNVNGVMHDNDGATAQCALDVMAAYIQLNDAIPDSSLAPLLGNGDTLKAGVYIIPAVTTLSGELFLNAEGDPNAVFIFQVQAAFSSGASSKVKLINGALACNVFWKVEGAVNMATGTSMKGTVIAHNDALNMSASDTLEGRALSIGGAVTINGIQAYTPTGCGSPVLTGPAAPTLGSVACFAIFSGSGPVTNAGTTYVTGDVGTNSGLTTGYNPLYVTGTIHSVPDGSTSAAAASLGNVYTYLNTLPHDIELLYPAQFGRNLVLTPHTYLMSAATSFTDSVYLDAKGNSNAVFVIKINGALTTGTFSKVLLINGTKAENVFWKVDGAVSINDYSVFSGTIVCNNGAIDLATGDSINGRALTTSGAVTTASSVVTANTSSCFILPVSWLYFRGRPVQKNVLLEWGAANEINNAFFTIEKSRDAVTFETLTTVNANAVIGNAERYYSFTDQHPYNSNYYRLSQTDWDGRKNYFRTILVKLNDGDGFSAMNYTLNNAIYIRASGAAPGTGFIELYSIEGKKISSQQIMLTKDESTYTIAAPQHKGIYIIKIISSRETLYNSKLMVL
jgi:Ice-binding-like